MRLLVTGCMGFIGSNLTTLLLQNGHEVLGFDDLSNPSILPTERIKSVAGDKWANFKFYKTSIDDLNQMLTIAHNYGNIDAIIHLAAIGSVPKSFEVPSNYFHINCTGFSNICCLASAMGIPKIVYASSSSVYGNATGPYRIENSIGEPLSPYALTKKTNEEMAKIWSDKTGIKMIGLRFFNVYGPGQRFDSNYAAVIPKFITSQKLIINGDGNQVRDFTHVLDVCVGIIKSLGYWKTHSIFNICTGKPTSIKNLAALLALEKQIEHKDARHGEVRESIGNTFLSKTELEFEAKFDILNGLANTKQFYSNLNKNQN